MRSEPPLNRAASSLSTTQIRQISGRCRNRGASTTSLLSLYLSVSLARTRASGSAARPSHCRERLTSGTRSRASAVPSFSGPLHQPGTGIPAGTDEMFAIRHLLSHGASWRRFTFCCYTFRPGGERRAPMAGRREPYQSRGSGPVPRPPRRETPPATHPAVSNDPRLPTQRRASTYATWRSGAVRR